MCRKCYNEEYLKTKNDKKKRSETSSKRVKASKDSWKDLEKNVAISLNNIPTIKDSRRSRMSGALPFEKGDVVDSIIHIECKERIGNIGKGAKKSFTIDKGWLEKSKEEADALGKPMCLPFRFKEDDTIYSVISMDDLAIIVTNIKALKNEIYILESQK